MEWGGIMRLLLIENEKSLSDILVKTFEKENFLTDCAHDGEYGLDCALSGIYDAIILDSALPKINGIELLMHLREGNVRVPIILIATQADLDEKQKILNVDVDDYLTKPFEPKELLKKVRTLIREQTNIDSDDSISFGDIVLNTANGELSCKGQKIKLSGKEYQLIELLLINKERIITKEQITEKIWGYDNEAEYNNSEVYMSFLRKKLSKIDSKTKIRAIRGLGYTLSY